MDPVVANIAKAVIPAGFIGLAAYAAAWWPLKGKPRQVVSTETHATTERRWVGPVVLAVVSLVAYILLNMREGGGVPSVLPGASSLTLWPAIVYLVVVLVLLHHFVPMPSWIKTAIALVVFAGLTAWSIRSQMPRMDAGSIIVLLAGAALYTLLFASLLEYVGQRQRGPVGPLAGMIVAGGASQVIILGFNTQTPAFLIAALAAVMGAAAMVAFLRPRLSVGHGGMAVLGVLIATALIQASVYGQAKGQFGVAYLVLMLASAASPWMVDAAGVPARVFGRTWVRGVLGLALAGFFAAAATGLAAAVMPEAY